jgi:hypothetical protein
VARPVPGGRPNAEPGGGRASGAAGGALITSKWAGHYCSSFTMKTYVHASDEDLKQGSQALAKIHRIG